MPTALWIVLGAVALVVVIWRVLAPSLDGAVARAAKTEEAGPLIETILKMNVGAQPNAFNHAIRRLWDDYKRPLTVPIILALAEHHVDAPIAQYWLDQLQGVEPELARETVDEEFLKTHYKPQVAAACGKAG